MDAISSGNNTKVKTLFTIYDAKGKGKQVYDGNSNVDGNQDVTVFEPIVFLNHKINEKTDISASFLFDVWTAASDTSLDGTTGASGAGRGAQARIAGSLGLGKKTDLGDFSFKLGSSTEYDYKSINASIGYAKSMAQDNFTLAVNLQRYKDELQLFDFAGQKMGPWVDRDITAVSVSGTQLLTRTAYIQVGADYTHAEGVLEATASTVLVGNTRSGEILPGTRDRQAYWTRLIQSLSEETALHYSYRYYLDSWNATAHTGRVAWLRSIQDDQGLIEFAYRLHQQKAVEYYADRFDALQNNMTSDSDLGGFTGHEVGAYYSYIVGDQPFFADFVGKKFTYTFGGNFYKRSTDLDMAWLSAGVSFEF